eukprot:g8123.t1
MSRTIRVTLWRRVWELYCQQLSERPFLTRALTSTIGIGTGDAIAQLYGEEFFSFQRLVKYSAFGFLVHGPGCHAFYKMLDIRLPLTQPNMVRNVLVRTSIDQSMWSPILLCVFYAFMQTWDGRPESTKTIIKQKFMTTYGTSLLFWIPAQIVNHALIPPPQRILYLNIVSVLWVVILSTITENKTLP